MATEHEPVIRNNRRTRLLHTATYLITTVLLITGWWLLSGHEGEQSFLARIVAEPDVELHRKAGWSLLGLVILAITVGVRGTVSFVRETLRVDRGDGRWFLHWPRAALTGRFPDHHGHFDPGQRIANVGFVATLGTLSGTGVALTNLHGGPTFVVLDRLHRYATYALTVFVIAHLVIATGILPGYRKVWRAMHLRGRTPAATARRIWPTAETPTTRHAGIEVPAATSSAEPRRRPGAESIPRCDSRRRS